MLLKTTREFRIQCKSTITRLARWFTFTNVNNDKIHSCFSRVESKKNSKPDPVQMLTLKVPTALWSPVGPMSLVGPYYACVYWQILKIVYFHYSVFIWRMVDNISIHILTIFTHLFVTSTYFLSIFFDCPI